MVRDTDYEKITARKAYQLYLQEKQQESAESTVRSHRSRLKHFIQWFQNETDYEYLYELGGLDLREYRLWRYDDTYSNDTIKTQQDTLRVFLRFCSDIDAVTRELPEKVQRPDRNGQRDNEIPHERAVEILEHLNRFEYATQEHVSFHLLWYGMLRVGTLYAIDMEDIDLSEGYIELKNRPKKGTRLKNGADAERVISIRPETVQLVQDYIDTHHHDITDDFGRTPLITTRYGRAHKTTIRNWVYSWTRPCMLGECPHETTPEQCEAAQSKNSACKCESSESTHALRRGSISWHLREGTGKSIVGDRADVSTRVLEKHYSTLTEREKADVRREKLPDD